MPIASGRAIRRRFLGAADSYSLDAGYRCARAAAGPAANTAAEAEVVRAAVQAVAGGRLPATCYPGQRDEPELVKPFLPTNRLWTVV